MAIVGAPRTSHESAGTYAPGAEVETGLGARGAGLVGGGVTGPFSGDVSDAMLADEAAAFGGASGWATLSGFAEQAVADAATKANATHFARPSEERRRLEVLGWFFPNAAVVDAAAA